MDRKTAKELLHIQGWLDRAETIVAGGKDAYLADVMLQEAGDSLMMKLGEAANRLERLSAAAPDGVYWTDAISNRNFLIHQYDQIDREISWATLSQDLPEWNASLATLVEQAEAAVRESADDASTD